MTSHEPSDLIVHQGGADRGAQPETFAQAASDIVLAAAFPSLERPGGSDAAFAGIEPEHDLEHLGVRLGRSPHEDALVPGAEPLEIVAGVEAEPDDLGSEPPGTGVG